MFLTALRLCLPSCLKYEQIVMLVVCRAAGLCPRFWVVFRSDPIKSYSSGCTAAPAPSTTPPPLSLCLGPCLRQARENVVLFLEGTATCRPKGWMEPEWAVISAITCAHVTGLAQGPCGVNHRRPGIIAAFPFQLQKAWTPPEGPHNLPIYHSN